MGNINRKYEPKFTNCRKCTVHFRLPDKHYYIQRRSCAFHSMKNGECQTCHSAGNIKCFHEKKRSFFNIY